MHGEDDQIVPVHDSATKSARLIKGAEEICGHVADSGVDPFGGHPSSLLSRPLVAQPAGHLVGRVPGAQPVGHLVRSAGSASSLRTLGHSRAAAATRATPVVQ
jgi:hypothetical protein